MRASASTTATLPPGYSRPGPLGSAAPLSPVKISLVDLPPTEAAALRLRCLKAAHERWNWETEGAKLVALYEDLAGST